MSSRRFVGGDSRRIGAALVLSAALGAAGAHAQTDEQRAGARAAATAGGQAFEDKRWAESIDYFTRAETLVHSPVHLLFMARAYEKLGALVKAREAYIRITNEELAPHAPQPMRDAKRDAQKELDALETRVPSVTVVVQGAGPKPVTVSMDGVQVPPALVGVPRPVDPGEHRFQALSEGLDSGVSALTVQEGRSENVVLVLHPAASGAAPPPILLGATAPGPLPGGQPPFRPMPPQEPGAPGGPGPAPGPDTLSQRPSPLTWVAFGVGAVGLGVGTVFALKAKSKADDATAQCSKLGPDGLSNWCTPEGVSLADDSSSARTIAIVGFVAGGVGVAAGVALFVLTRNHKAATATSFEPFVGLGSAGVRGKF